MITSMQGLVQPAIKSVFGGVAAADPPAPPIDITTLSNLVVASRVSDAIAGGDLWQNSGKTTQADANNDPVYVFTPEVGNDYVAGSGTSRLQLNTNEDFIRTTGTEDYLSATIASTNINSYCRASLIRFESTTTGTVFESSGSYSDFVGGGKFYHLANLGTLCVTVPDINNFYIYLFGGDGTGFRQEIWSLNGSSADETSYLASGASGAFTVASIGGTSGLNSAYFRFGGQVILSAWPSQDDKQTIVDWLSGG